MASISSTLNSSPLSWKTFLALSRDDLAHLLFNGREIFRRERRVAEEIVIEAIVDHRTNRDLGAGPQSLHGLGEHMRSIVADELERARILAGEKLDSSVVLDRIGEVGDLAVERHGHRALGERRRNAFGYVEAGGVWRVVPTRAVGKGQRDHHSLLLLTRCLRCGVS